MFAAFALIASACGGDDEVDVSDFRIAIVAPSASNDLAFTQSIVDAVKAMGVEPSITDGTFVVEDAAAAIRGYAAEGYDLVIGHGSQYGGSLEEIAKDFPEVAFAWGTAADTFGLPNVYAYEAASDEGGYVMGVMAAALSSTGNIGVVGPIEVGDAKLYVDGFIAGVASGGASAVASYTGSFSDVALASETAQAFASQDVDVLSGTAQMVVGAISIANEQGILWFGTQANQTELAPEIVVASQVYHWEVILETIIQNVQDGTLGGEVFEINLDNEGIVIEYNDDYDLPGDVKDLANDAIDGIKDGSISTG
ncbi:MAG: BMP family ABC transporter substrate-binding protein [bacterium]|nr:BMP family ABC transporter substrate-binding protein [bacterium]